MISVAVIQKYKSHQCRPRLKEDWCPEGCLDLFPRIKFTQEKVLITGPANDCILKEVHLQTPKDEKYWWPEDPKMGSKTSNVAANVINTV